MLQYCLNGCIAIQTLIVEKDVVIRTVTIKEIGNERIPGFSNQVSVQRVINRWSIVRALRQKITVMHRLQVLVHQPRPRKVEGHDLQCDAHGDVGVEIYLPERPQLPATTRQVPQDSATGEPEKDFANGGAADAIPLCRSFFAKQHGSAFEAELGQIVGNDGTPVDGLLR